MANVPPPAPAGGDDQGGDASADDAQMAGGGKGGVTEVLVETDANLASIAKMTAQNEQIPDEVKAYFQQASDSYRQGLQALQEVAGGGGGAPGGPGAVAPEAGGNPGAVPMTPAGVKRG